MGFFNKIFGRVLLIVQFILVFLFILFEEIIWEGIAKPIYNKIESLKITQKLEAKIEHTHRYVILAIFSILLLGVEAAGLLAGVFFVQGQVLLGLVLYVAKIPIAAFVFWLFKAGKEKLLSFHWFNWSYEKLMAGLEWLKERESYQSMMRYMLEIKTLIKEKWKIIKAKYFAEEGSFMKELKGFYKYMKNFKNNTKKDNKDIKKGDKEVD
ncbi:MAG: Bll5565 protein [uncultured Sulfurovum sp.]|uniref:Bll5565 protein n=1 Tax=uncultured Sulfurovum sp. TaxID=269237 RepID=A0A6S6TRV8_9BACT|nr:MAG: Bll5565 protein [uncultured Sulfurovum sp.]